MPSKTWTAVLAGSVALSMATGALAAPRFAPLTPDQMTPEQKAIPLIRKGLETGRYNPNGLDAILARHPGLQEAIGALASVTYPVAAKLYMGRDDPASVPPALMEIAILRTAQYWDFPQMFKSHGPLALKDGVSQATLDALAAGRRPADMKPDEAAIYDFTDELATKRDVSDATFGRLRQHLSERQVVDLVATLSSYVGSLMMLKVAGTGSH